MGLEKKNTSQLFFLVLSKCAGVEIHSFRSHILIMDHFVLEWKSTLKTVESTLKECDSNHYIYFGVDSTIIWLNQLQ